MEMLMLVSCVYSTTLTSTCKKLFSIECSQVRAISNNNSLLPPENVDYSLLPDMYDEDMNISTGWCSYTDMSPSVYLTFVEPVYLLYAVGSFYNNGFSVTYKNPFGENVTYTNMDGIYVRSVYCNYNVL